MKSILTVLILSFSLACSAQKSDTVYRGLRTGYIIDTSYHSKLWFYTAPQERPYLIIQPDDKIEIYGDTMTVIRSLINQILRLR